ncbi:unnamed protein product [Symbiodinium sp. CCMP2592]|nr:unnamed protein product [Symbiodinium sp. CCMP2592]
MKVLEEWEHVFATETDFLSPEMANKHDRALLCMNSLGTMIEHNLPGQPAEHQGLLLLELCKFVVPLLPPTDVQGARVYPWLLTKGPDSKEMQEVDVKLFTAIAGAPFVSKLGQKRAPGTKSNKVKAAAIEDEEDKKKQTAKGKAKSKAKAKAGKRKAQGDDEMLEPSSALQGPVEFGEGSRPRRWLDDLLGALVAANYGKPLLHQWNSPAGQMTRMLVSYGLEFALTGKLSLNNKIFKDWSKVRPYLQSLMRAMIKKSAGESLTASAASTDAAADNMVSHLFARVSEEKAALENQSAGAGGGSDEDVSDVKAWVRFVLFSCKATVDDAGVFLSKNTGSIESHPAFRGFRGVLREVTCTCNADADAEAEACCFHYESEHSIQDLVWGVTECLRVDEESVPSSVLRVGLALLGAVAIHASGLQKQADGSDGSGEKVQTIAEIVGKHAKPLALIENEQGELVFNEQAIEGMIVCRALYMLLGLRQVIEKPLEPQKFVTVSDVPSLPAFASLLDYLLSKDGKSYVMEIESRCHFAQKSQKSQGSQDSKAASSESAPDLWCSTWSRVLGVAVRAQAQAAKAAAAEAENVDQQGPDPKRAKTTKPAKDSKTPEVQIQPPADPKSWADFLPSSTILFSTKSLADTFLNTITTPTATSPNEAEATEAVKKEAATASASASAAAKPQASESAKQVELLNKTPTLASIYNMHNLAGAKSLNVLDVLAVGMQVQTHMLQKSAWPVAVCHLLWLSFDCFVE